MKEKYLNNNPEFAYKLFSTLGIGSVNMSNLEEKICREIWQESNNTRFDVLIKVVQICGTVDSPLARYVRAKAWSWNSVVYSSNAISAIIDYINNDLYEEEFKNNLLFDSYEQRKRHHLFFMYLDLAKAYEGIKDYNKAIAIYNKSKRFVVSQIPYVKIAERYKIMKEYDKALEELENARKNKYAKYPKSNDAGQDCIDLYVIDRYYKSISNAKIGIKKHEFVGYDRIEALDNPKIFISLKDKYKTLFEKRRKVLERKDLLKILMKENVDSKVENEYIDICNEDIKYAIETKKFYNEINKFTRNDYQVNDNGRNGIDSLKDLVIFYKKRKDFKSAIEICELAINNGFYDYNKDKTYNELKDEFIKKSVK